MGEPVASDNLAEMERTFAFFDEDGDGIVQAKDIFPLFWTMGKAVTVSAVRDIAVKINPSGEGSFDFEAFLIAMNYPFITMLKQKFLSFVKKYGNSSGCIHVEILRWVLHKIGRPLNDFKIDRVLADMTVNADKSVNYTDFIDLLLQ